MSFTTISGMRSRSTTRISSIATQSLPSVKIGEFRTNCARGRASEIFRAELYGESGGFWPAFLIDGAVSLIATLTFVNQDAAHTLALAFYDEWDKPNCTNAEALCRAQGRQSPYEPEHWFSHVLVGCHR